MSSRMSVGKMTPQEIERMNRLCKLIQEEQDQQKLTELVIELKTLLASGQSAVFLQNSAPQSN
jgi:hypothetical protein